MAFLTKLGYQLLLISIVLFIAGCSDSPSQLKDWYAENYPRQRTTIQKERQNGQEKHDTKQASSSPGLKKASAADGGKEVQSGKMDYTPLSHYSETGRTTGSLKMVKGSLEDPVDLKFAASKPKLSEYNVSSMIEGKLLKLVEDAYLRRDENEFTRLYKFFLDSFPQSARKSYLEEKWRTFFYSEELDVAPLKDGLVEVTYPQAKDMEEFSHYLASLKSTGVSTIQLDMVQVFEQPVYLFAKPENPLGYYFKTPSGPLVDNLLDKITALAHDNGLRVLISFPLRNHPMLGHQSILMVDETWDSIQNRTTPNGKLDLLNPHSHRYLAGLVQSLLASRIDGIVFKDDFTYELNEGFSAVARQQYLKATGKTILFNHLFVPVKANSSSRFEILTDEDFMDIAVWRTREIKQLLWDLISNIRKEKRSFVLGVEVTPEMVLQENLSVKYYSTGLSYLKDLDLDLIVLKWRKTGSEAESDHDSYQLSARTLRSEVLPKTNIYMKVPLSHETNNVIRLNSRIHDNVKIQQDMESTKMAIGPVTRLKRLDFLNGRKP